MRATRRLGGITLILALWGGPSCDNDEATVQDAAPEPEAAAEPAPPPPSVDPKATPGVELIDAGKEPRAVLGVVPTLGAKRPLVVALRVTKRGRKKKPWFPFVRFEVDSTLQTATQGSKTRQLALRSLSLPDSKSDDPAKLTEMQGTFRSALSKVSQVETDGLETAKLSADVKPEMRAVVSAAEHALGHLSIAVPSDAIGKGATWEVRRDVRLFGVSVRETMQCTLDKVDGAQIEVSAKIEYALAPGASAQGSATLELASVTSVSGTAKLGARIDAASASPVEVRIRGRLKFLGTNVEGKERSKRLGIDLRVDEDYLERADPRVRLDGEFEQGGLVHGVAPAGSKVWFNKKRVKVSPEGDFLIGFGRSAPARALLSFALPDAATERHIVQIGDRTFEPEKIDGLPERMVKLDKATKKALAVSRRRIKKVRNKATTTPFFRDGWRWPAKGKITSTYGRKRTLNGVDKGFHWGIDIAAPVGRSVVAPAPGKVVFAEEEVPLSGMLLILDHGHGLTSSFLHLSDFTVEVGDVVEAGQEIAEIGNTGRSTGPHLDWRMNLFQTRIDPQLLVADTGPPG